MRKRWLKLIAFLGMLFFLTILTSRYFAASTTAPTALSQTAGDISSLAGECTQCHEMLPEVLTWQVSSHSKFPCQACHVDNKTSDYKQKHQNQSFSKPIKTVNPIANSVCLKCHSSNRVVSPSGDLLIPHAKHLNAGITCVKCHSGVVHAGIAERDLSYILTVKNYTDWNLAVAKQVSSESYVRPSMWLCIECHKQAVTTQKCGTCHTSMPTLPTHDLTTWGSEHGKYARKDIGVCVTCHATSDLPTFLTPGSGDKAADFARAQPYCYRCHSQKPEMHAQSMVPIHPNLVANRDSQNCLTCHNIEQPATGEKATKTYCNQCHWY
ncbi:MAG TPA: cytochrome c3 family protein [Verrucomicrobiae bacterium]|nr:cytochrome c3 family protein [Verrucomicrobiae bacterium]